MRPKKLRNLYIQIIITMKSSKILFQIFIETHKISFCYFYLCFGSESIHERRGRLDFLTARFVEKLIVHSLRIQNNYC